MAVPCAILLRNDGIGIPTNGQRVHRSTADSFPSPFGGMEDGVLPAANLRSPDSIGSFDAGGGIGLGRRSRGPLCCLMAKIPGGLTGTAEMRNVG